MRYVCYVVTLALSLFGMVSTAQTQPFPNKPVRMIVGYTAGSEIDVIARMLAQEMSAKWGQPVVVDNRPGAGGTLAGAIAAVAVADGYTLFFNSVSHAASSALYPKLSYNPVRDFAGISQATSAPNVLVAGPGMATKSIQEMIALAKQKPGQINFGSAGMGSGTHITLEMFRLGAALNVTHIPYKGVPEVLTDTMTGRVHFSFAPIGNAQPLVKEKRLTALAVTMLTRAPSLPEVPTIAETALPGFHWDQWYGLFAPVKTPRPIVTQISEEMARILAMPAIKDRIAIRGSVPKSSTPAEFDKYVSDEADIITKVIKEGGVKLE
jgi:tripartite-type tricarboxylate transporter receptor subunit TctC